MTTRFTAKFDGRVLIPEEPLDLPVGESIVFEPVRQAAPVNDRPLRRLAEIAKQFPPDPESPGDAAAQHDHYLYGTPKRDNP